MTINVFSEDIYISEDETKKLAQDVLDVLKEKLPKEYHKECIISVILSEAKRMLNFKTLDL